MPLMPLMSFRDQNDISVEADTTTWKSGVLHFTKTFLFFGTIHFMVKN